MTHLDEKAFKLAKMQDSNNPYTLCVLRGLPGSGKSYRAKQLANNDLSIICSADSFFGEDPEEYRRNWKAEKLFIAHKTCQNKVVRLMKQKVPLVIVDNTNLTLKEISPYFQMAYNYDYRFIMEESESSWWKETSVYLKDKQKYKTHLMSAAHIFHERNQHGVPLDTLTKMIAKFQPDLKFEDFVSRLEMVEPESYPIYLSNPTLDSNEIS